jgi:GT2 family glycosyltransferase
VPAPIPPFPDDVDVGVVSHNGRQTLPRLFECLAAAGAPEERIRVYDVGSTDGTKEWLADAHPQVVVRRLDENVGPDPGRNWALRDATRPFLLLLDADALLHADAPARLRQSLDPVARVGTVTPVTLSTPDVIQYAGGGLHFICEAINPFYGKALADRGTELLDIGAAPAVALLIDVKAAHHIGLWDDRYFIGKEDGDFSFRLRMAGYRLVEDPKALVDHATRPRSTWLFRHQIRNRWHFLLKNYELRTLIVIAPALVGHELIQLVMLTVRGHLGVWWQALKELISWLPTLRAERRVIQGIRTVRDRDLLEYGPLLVRPDIVGGGVGQALKRGYDAWLGAYWAVARHLLS